MKHKVPDSTHAPTQRRARGGAALVPGRQDPRGGRQGQGRSPRPACELGFESDDSSSSPGIPRPNNAPGAPTQGPRPGELLLAVSATPADHAHSELYMD